jgi:hypothetical protein
MFDAFKKLIASDEDAPTPEEKAAAMLPKQRKSGPDRLTISGKGALSIPGGPAESAGPTAAAVPLPDLDDPGPISAPAPRTRVPITLGLGDLLRAKPMQHFVMLADSVDLDSDYDHHDIVGRYFEIGLPTFPGVDRFISITFWGFNFQGDHTVNMRIMNIDDQVIAELEAPYRFRLERASDTHESRTVWQVLFPAPGTYHLVVETDGRPTAVAPIFVTRDFGEL